MRQSTKLIANTLAVAGRMAITVWIGLFITSKLVEILGIEDFGLLTVLGASGSLVTLLSLSLNLSAQRHLAFELGRGDDTRLREVFSTTLAVYIALTAMVGIGLLLLRPVILGVLDIPSGRMEAAGWVFIFAVVSVMFTILRTPFVAAMQARQQLGLTATIELIDRILALAIVLSLAYVPWDKLVTYSGLSVALSGVLFGTTAILCVRLYSETRPGWHMRWNMVRELLSWAGWGVFGSAAFQASRQGSLIVLNLACGPAINGSYAIALRIAEYQRRLVTVLLNVISPATVTAEGRSGAATRERFFVVGCKFPALAGLLLGVPILVETRLLLELWIGELPEHVITFSFLLALAETLMVFTSGYQMGMNAIGKIRQLMLWDSAPMVLVLVGCAMALLIFPERTPAWILPAGYAGYTLFATVVIRPVVFGRSMGIAYRLWAGAVLGPILIVASCSVATVFAIQHLVEPSVWRLLLAFGANALMVPVVAWFVALKAEERAHFQRVAGGLWQRARRLNR